MLAEMREERRAVTRIKHSVIYADFRPSSGTRKSVQDCRHTGSVSRELCRNE